MAAFKINVDVNEVRNSAKTLDGHKTSLSGYLDNIYNQVRKLEGTSWSSDASREIYENMGKMKQKFEKQDQVIQAFVDFLNNQVADQYERLETATTSNAAKFKQ